MICSANEAPCFQTQQVAVHHGHIAGTAGAVLRVVDHPLSLHIAQVVLVELKCLLQGPGLPRTPLTFANPR